MRKEILLVVSGLALTAPVAAAQDDRVFVDPDSPSAKEYALPVDAARAAARSQTQNGASNPQAAPLFGAGVERERDGAGAAAPKRVGRAGGASNGGKDSASESGARHATAGAAARKAQAAAPGGAGGVLAAIGVGSAVLLLGGLAGLLLRRRPAR